MKKGITISILVVTIVLMFIIVTTATVVGTRTIQTAAYEEFLSKVERVSNDVNKYIIGNDELPTTMEIVAKEGLPTALVTEINRNNDSSNNLFVIDMTKLKTESVNIGKGTVQDMDVFIVAENTNNVYYLKGIEYRGTTYYGVDVVGNEPSGMPAGWEENVVAIVDTVPIPKGFVASSATGENTKDGGLVIYEGTEAVTDTNIEEAKRDRNQYVWVPVEDFGEFRRQDFDDSGMISDTLGGDEYWEVLLDMANKPINTQDFKYITSETLAEVQSMYESVEEYKGFYIARYEAGLDIENPKIEYDGTKVNGVYFGMNKRPINNIMWSYSEEMNGALEISRSIYPETNPNYGVISTLVYGVQWDSILSWWIDAEAKNGTEDVILDSYDELMDSARYGNYANTEMLNGVFNIGAAVSENLGETYEIIGNEYVKYEDYSVILSTGASEMTRVNNIYDMAGNLYEWTMERYATECSSVRGGSYEDYGDATVFNRDYYYSNEAMSFIGFRTSLYIKK